jgi:hypothetical protein
VLDLTVREGHEIVALQKVEHALAKEIHDNADMSSEIEAISEVDATVPVLLVVGPECLENPKLNLAGFAVLLDRANDLDGNELIGNLVSRLHNFAERALSE